MLRDRVARLLGQMVDNLIAMQYAALELRMNEGNSRAAATDEQPGQLPKKSIKPICKPPNRLS